MGAGERIDEEDLLWVRWNEAARKRHLEFAGAIARFDPGLREPGQAAAAWLQDHGLGGESQPYLGLFEHQLVGSYALMAGQVELASGARDNEYRASEQLRSPDSQSSDTPIANRGVFGSSSIAVCRRSSMLTDCQ